MNFVVWMEQSALAVWIREADTLLAFPAILLMHTIGLALLVGLSFAIDLRLLGCVPRVPLAPMERLFPLMWFGFWINAISGTLLLIADASRKFANPDFYVKMVFVALGTINLVLMRSHVFRDPVPGKTRISMNAKTLAATSLIFWTGAIAAGRLLAYLGPPRH